MSRTLAQLVREAGLSASPELAAYVEAAEQLRVYVLWEDPFDAALLGYDAAAMALFQALVGKP